MSHLKYLVLIVFILLATSVMQDCQAQVNTDSLNARKRYENELKRKDSIIQNAKRLRTKDSLSRVLRKKQLLEYRDSLKLALLEKRKQDSLKRVELKLKMLAERQKRDSIRLAKKEEIQKAIANRKRIADSLIVIRKARTDSITAARLKARKIREALKKYKNSKGYKDSVAQVRQIRKDKLKEERDKKLAKLKAERMRRIDSTKKARNIEIAKIKKERKRVLDSTLAARKSYNDSIKLVRTKRAESLKLARQKRKDSLENTRSKTKIASKKKKSISELKKEEADKIHARKKGSWTNEKLLKKGWNIKRRIWQNTVTRYNSYYNAERKYTDAMDRLTDKYKESYTERISLYPYDLNSGLNAIGSDMDSVIKKCAYDTHIHDPRSKWFDNLYLLMGKAFFFKNDYDGAITAFQYVVNEYKDGDAKKKQKRGYVKLPELNEIKLDKDNKIRLATQEKRTGLKLLAHHPIRNEALIWLARAHTKNKQFSEAQSLLSIMEEDKIFPDRLRDDLFMAMAELNFEQGNNLSAIEPLEKAVKAEAIGKQMKNRANYLLAQLYAQDGNLEKSNKYFNEALKAKLPIEMEYFTRLSLAQNAINGNGNKAEAIIGLETLARADKFDKWRAQSFLSLGQILQESDPENALKNFDNSLSAEKNRNQKAAAFLGKGEIYYKQAKYANAKLAYDSVVIYSKTAMPVLENMDQIQLRKEVLGSLIKYTNVISNEDSLQTLSRKSEKEKIAVIKKELRRLAKKKRDRLKAESAKLVGASLVPGKFGKNAWYFYNNTSVQQGLFEFKTKWGERNLRDNWRRSGSQGIGSGLPLAGTDSTGGKANESLTKNAEVLKMLSALYTTPNDFEQSDKKVKDAYFQLGLIYSSRLQEYKTSIQTFDALNLRFAKHDQLAATYYSKGLSYQKLKQQAKADQEFEKIKKEFPNSEFAKLIDGSTEKQDENYAQLEILYDTAYQMLQRYEYDNAFNNATASLSKYPESILQSKLELVQAKSLAGLKKYDSSIAITEKIIKGYPGSQEQQHAQDFLRYLKKAKTGSLAGFDNSKTFKEEKKIKDPNAVYTFDKNEEHYYMLFLSSLKNIIPLKSGFSDYNLFKHAAKKLRTKMRLITSKSAVLTVVQFKNAERANRYAKLTRNESKLFSQVSSANFKELIISKSNYVELLKTRKVEDYFKFYKEKY